MSTGPGADPLDPFDPKGLIREAYRIDGIDAAQCRSIFVDWALSLPDTVAPAEALPTLIARYVPSDPAHPMSGVLQDGLSPAMHPRRRGGWRSRRAPAPSDRTE